MPVEADALGDEDLLQRLEGREFPERRAAPSLERAEFVAPRRRCAAEMALPEDPVELLEDRALQGGDRDMIDELGVAHPRQDASCLGRGRETLRLLAFAEFRHGLDIDIEIVEEEPARRRVRADVPRLGGEEGVERVDTDRARMEPGGSFGEEREIAEIADPPIAPGAERVELDREPPDAAAFAQRLRQIAGGRRDDQRHPALARTQSHLELMIAARQLRQPQAAPHHPMAGCIAGALRLRLAEPDLAFVRPAVFRRQAPFDHGVDVIARCRDRDQDRGRLLRNDHDRIDKAAPALRLLPAQQRLGVALAWHGEPHRGEQRLDRFARHLLGRGPGVTVARLDACLSGKTRQMKRFVHVSSGAERRKIAECGGASPGVARAAVS